MKKEPTDIAQMRQARAQSNCVECEDNLHLLKEAITRIAGLEIEIRSLDTALLREKEQTNTMASALKRIAISTQDRSRITKRLQWIRQRAERAIAGEPFSETPLHPALPDFDSIQPMKAKLAALTMEIHSMRREMNTLQTERNQLEKGHKIFRAAVSKAIKAGTIKRSKWFIDIFSTFPDRAASKATDQYKAADQNLSSIIDFGTKPWPAEDTEPHAKFRTGESDKSRE